MGSTSKNVMYTKSKFHNNVFCFPQSKFSLGKLKNGYYCSDYDARFRPWYAAAASGPKDVVLTLDNSGSMLNNGAKKRSGDWTGEKYS